MVSICAVGMGGTRRTAVRRAAEAAGRAELNMRAAAEMAARMPRDWKAVAAAKRANLEYELAALAAARAAEAAGDQTEDEREANMREAAYTLAAARRALRDESAPKGDMITAILRAGNAAMSTHDRAAVKAVKSLGQMGKAHMVTWEEHVWTEAERKTEAAGQKTEAAERKARGALNPIKLVAAAEAWAVAAEAWAVAAEAWAAAGVG